MVSQPPGYRGNHAVQGGLYAGLQKEISFQQFRNQLLAKGVVEKLEVSNKAVVKVYLKSSPTAGSFDSEMQGGRGSPSPAPPLSAQPQAAKYFFNVGSVDSFERNMEEAQEALGISLGDEVTPPPHPPPHTNTHTYGTPGSA